MAGLGEAGRPVKLPARRISRCEKVEYRVAADASRPASEENCRVERKFFVRCGFAPDGSVREVFFAAKRETSDMVELASDTCILISKQLQDGARLGDLAVQAPAGLLGTIIATAIKMERECAAEVMAQYAHAGVVAS